MFLLIGIEAGRGTTLLVEWHADALDSLKFVRCFLRRKVTCLFNGHPEGRHIKEEDSLHAVWCGTGQVKGWKTADLPWVSLRREVGEGGARRRGSWKLQSQVFWCVRVCVCSRVCVSVWGASAGLCLAVCVSEDTAHRWERSGAASCLFQELSLLLLLLLRRCCCCCRCSSACFSLRRHRQVCHRTSASQVQNKSPVRIPYEPVWAFLFSVFSDDFLRNYIKGIWDYGRERGLRDIEQRWRRSCPQNTQSLIYEQIAVSCVPSFLTQSNH